MVRTVNRSRGEHGDVYIGRPSKWGNPFIIGRDGDRATVVEKYRAWLWDEIKAGRVTEEQLLELSGKTLECFCSPQQCHGDVLIAAVAWAEGRRYEC